MGSSPRVCLNVFEVKGISLPHCVCACEGHCSTLSTSVSILCVTSGDLHRIGALLSKCFSLRTVEQTCFGGDFKAALVINWFPGGDVQSVK